MNEITLNTRLGNFWEQVVADELDSLGIAYDRSPELGAGIIRPDFVSKKQKVTIFVTCTGTRESFIKKRWRYINELFQAKGVLGDEMLVANLVLATDSNLQAFEKIIFKKLFDIAAFGNDFTDFEKHYTWVRAEIEAGSQVAAICAIFQTRPDTQKFRAELRKWLKGTLSATPAEFGGLWAAVESYQSKRKLSKIVPHKATYWRHTCLKLLPLTAAERSDVLLGIKGKKVKIDIARLHRAGIKATRTISGAKISDAETTSTLTTFSEEQITSTLKVLDKDNAAIGFPLEEVVDDSKVKAAYSQYKSSFSSEKDFTAKAIAEFKDAKADRIRVWEYAVSLADTSLLDINKEYVQKWGKIVVANPINNIILKTDIGLAIAKATDIAEVIKRASSIIWKRLPRHIDEPIYLTRVTDYRKRSLFLQPYINPTQRLFEKSCLNVLGSTPKLSSFDGLLGDLGIAGRASRVEALYVFKFSTVIYIFKVLAGYKGGYEHKADEMASRAWLLRFRFDPKTGKALSAPMRLVFIYEGEWDEQYLTLLHASGWDDIVHLSQVEDYLKGIKK